MFQQIIALLVIAFLLERTYRQHQKKLIGKNELWFWIVFWISASFAVIFIKQIDALLRSLGFSATGINFLLYISIVAIFYFIFRLRLRVEKLEKSLTRLTREDALKNFKK